ncbi:MAG: glucuronate isomerase [Ruminococcaceae bacterium]|nr:glucuronate isomerase [Oscillospiraceae bacterium]
MSYIRDNFLLTNKTAEVLYNRYAKDMPIFDYHCHLPERQILENKPFGDIFEIWLAGDHYKWRLMRNYGMDEEYITGNRTNKEKFKAYCTVLGTAFGNPLYHWSQVELKDFFGCELEINEANADAIWEECNAYIRENALTPQKLIEGSNVKHVYTTNEIFDELSTFEEIAKKDYNFTVNPAFRADRIMNIDGMGYTGYIDRVAAQTHEIKDLCDLEDAIELRLQAFIKVGCRASDIALERVYAVADKADAAKVFEKVLSGEDPTAEDAEIFKGYFTYFLMKLYAKYGISTELHLGAMRNNNAKMMQKLGPDTGFDSISDTNSITLTSRLFDRLNNKDSLPKVILFNLNPKMNTEMMTIIGCFQDGTPGGKMQYGPAWWFLDNKVGMENHLRDLTATGHLAVFVGMLTDSRSLLSYPRHHYFRRILCNYLGDMMEKGEMTQDMELVGKVVQDISYNNSVNYFGLKD